MTILENYLRTAVGLIPATSVGKAAFYWGTAEDLPQFLQLYGDNGIPLVWLVSGKDVPTEDGYVRKAQIVLATREDREDIDNLTRVSEGYSYQEVLEPLKEGLLRQINISENLWMEDGFTEQKIPNYVVSEPGEGETRPVDDIWDVLRLEGEVFFNSETGC